MDGEGITGLELQYDDVLSGTPGTYSAERGQNGIPIPGGVHEETPAVDGQDIMISIDIQLQEYVEERLEQGAKDIGAEGGTAVVMDGGTGEIYAAATLPYLNPADMRHGGGGRRPVEGRHAGLRARIGVSRRSPPWRFWRRIP